jgi:hypothetical protein
MRVASQMFNLQALVEQIELERPRVDCQSILVL